VQGGCLQPSLLDATIVGTGVRAGHAVAIAMQDEHDLTAAGQLPTTYQVTGGGPRLSGNLRCYSFSEK